MSSKCTYKGCAMGTWTNPPCMKSLFVNQSASQAEDDDSLAASVEA